jgi:hypothetical protein
MSKHDRRYWGAGPWPGGEFYVWDSRTSSIANPDGEDAGLPWRRLNTMAEAEEAAKKLNEVDPDPIYRLFRDHPERGASSYLADHYKRGLQGVMKPDGYPALSAWRAGRDTATSETKQGIEP